MFFQIQPSLPRVGDFAIWEIAKDTLRNQPGRDKIYARADVPTRSNCFAVRIGSDTHRTSRYPSIRERTQDLSDICC